MGLFNGLLGNASNISNEKVYDEVGDLLADSESVKLSYKLVRDLLVFTDKRIILIDKQGVTAKKTSYQSIPYKNISRFELESAGHFDLESELKIWISGNVDPVMELTFRGKDDVKLMHRAISEAVLY